MTDTVVFDMAGYPYSPDDMCRCEIENQLNTVGVLRPEWREQLVETSLFRIESRLSSAGVTACEINDLGNRKLALLDQLGKVVDSPVPTFGQHPGHSRPGRTEIGADTDTEGSGD